MNNEVFLFFLLDNFSCEQITAELANSFINNTSGCSNIKRKYMCTTVDRDRLIYLLVNIFSLYWYISIGFDHICISCDHFCIGIGKDIGIGFDKDSLTLNCKVWEKSIKFYVNSPLLMGFPISNYPMKELTAWLSRLCIILSISIGF